MARIFACRVIVSRAAELGRLEDLLAAMIRGEGGALVVHGEAGIGKTTLLEALVERAGDAVMVARACGAEPEAELAFSALADLLGPMLSHLDALPVPQAAVLMGALALEPPTPGDRLAVCVAALGVLRSPGAPGFTGDVRSPAKGSGGDDRVPGRVHPMTGSSRGPRPPPTTPGAGTRRGDVSYRSSILRVTGEARGRVAMAAFIWTHPV